MVMMHVGDADDVSRGQPRNKLKGVEINNLASPPQQESIMPEPLKIFENFLHHKPSPVFPISVYNQFDTFRNLL
jgi:hypothetical protein